MPSCSHGMSPHTFPLVNLCQFFLADPITNLQRTDSEAVCWVNLSFTNLLFVSFPFARHLTFYRKDAHNWLRWEQEKYHSLELLLPGLYLDSQNPEHLLPISTIRVQVTEADTSGLMTALVPTHCLWLNSSSSVNLFLNFIEKGQNQKRLFRTILKYSACD